MHVEQQAIPMGEFAAAMRARSPEFAARVRQFERAFGRADADTLAVLAQAHYFCWFEAEYEADFSGVCRAIGSGRPTTLCLCRQVTPRRWMALHAYVIGVQRWLGVGEPLPDGIDRAKVAQIGRWLGRRDRRRDALAELYVCHLVVDHVLPLSLARLGGAPDSRGAVYLDLATWYRSAEGTALTLQDRDRLIERLRRRALWEMRDALEDGQALVENILRPSQPPCQHRFTRYQDIQISSIGALRWRGNVPPDDDCPRGQAAAWFEAADLEGWLEGRAARTPVAAAVHEALGRPTAQKKAIVRDSLCQPPDSGCYDWLEDRARRDGTTASARFGRAG